MVLFSFQIFCDFAGYSSIARGLAYLLGFRLPLNFNAPYTAMSFRDFWTRWHISLSQWFRDYLYIPLGGNRHGVWRTAVNLMLTFVVSGLWHGAARTFLLWGFMHGAALVVERAFNLHRMERRWQRVSWFVVVQITVLLTWVVFRAKSIPQAGGIVSNAMSFRAEAFGDFPWLACAVLLLGPLIVHIGTFARERRLLGPPAWWERPVPAAVMLYACFTAYGVDSAFIYFQF